MTPPAWLVRNVNYPLHEKLRRRPTLSFYNEMIRLNAAARDEIESLARERLRELLTFAETHLPYYRRIFKEHGLDSTAVDPYAELERLPVLSKNNVREHAAGMIWRDVRGGLTRCGSGGTTGDTLHFHIDRAREAQPLGCRLFMQELFGVRPGDRRVHLWGSPIESRASWLKRRRDRMLNELLLDAFDLGPAALERYLEAIRDYRPSLIYAYPTAAALLARLAAQCCRPVDFDWLKLVVMTGEEITEDQREQVQAAFGCATASEYGSREIGLIAHECPRGGLHVMSPHIHVEIMAGEDAAPRGELGEIVCTNFTTRGQPLIRYRAGDIGRLLDEPCDCGAPFPLMSLDGGRTTGFVVLSDGRLCHGAISSCVLRDEPGIVQFKTIQKQINKFEVLLVVDGEFDPETPTRIEKRYRTLFGHDVHVKCRLVDTIPADPSGKRRHVVSEVAPDLQKFKIVRPPNVPVGCPM